MSDTLAAIRARIEAAKAIKIVPTKEQEEKDSMLRELRAEADRVKAEQQAEYERIEREVRFDIVQRLPGTFLDSVIIEGIGPIIAHAPSGAESRILTDAAKKGNVDAAQMTFALSVTEYPDKEAMKKHLIDKPFLVNTIVDMGMKLGGLRQEADRKSG